MAVDRETEYKSELIIKNVFDEEATELETIDKRYIQCTGDCLVYNEMVPPG